MSEKKKEEELLIRARHLCSEREYCISDIKLKLQQWGEKDDEIMDRVIRKLVTEKFIDECRYCRAFAKDHFRQQRWGRIKIINSLKMKMIPDTAISEGLSTIDENEYLNTLKTILETHRRTVKSSSRYDLKGKLLRHALGKGFESHLVYEAINEMFRD